MISTLSSIKAFLGLAGLGENALEPAPTAIVFGISPQEENHGKKEQGISP
jgi:hypothetical protein